MPMVPQLLPAHAGASLRSACARTAYGRWTAVAALVLIGLLSSARALSADEAPLAKDAKTVAPTSDLARLETEFVAAPDDVAKGLAYLNALLADGQKDRALKCFRRNAAERPSDSVAAFLLARVEGQSEGFRAMWAALMGRLGRPPGDDAGLLTAWDALAAAEEAEGRDERAAAALEQRIQVGADAGAWVRLGWLRERLQNLTGAEEAYRKAFALDAEARAPRNGLALVLARQKKHAEAQRFARLSVEKAPESADAWIHLGLVLSLAGNAKEAGEAFKQALEHARGDAAALAVIGSSLAEIEQFDLAEKALAAALAAAPADGTALTQAAVVAVQREQWVEAKRLLALAQKALPKSAQVAFLQGVCARRTQQADAAVNAFRRAVMIEPAEPAYALALAQAHEDKGAPEQALAVLLAAVEHAPASAEIQLRIGFLQMQKKRWPQAVEAFRRAASLAPKDPDPHLYLAVVYGDHMDMAPEAQKHLEEYQKLGGREATALAWLKELQAREPKK